jgi:predicted amidohydrolase YtcJ
MLQEVPGMFAALLLSATLSADPFVSVDLVVVNAKVWTGDPAKPEAQAIAVWNGQILKVGTDDDVKKLAGASTKVIDAGGKRVLPGFYDSHVHFLGGGLQLARVELKDCKDEAEFAQRLKDFDSKTPSDRWMLGGNWDHDRSFAGQLPTTETLDKYVKDRPVFLRRYDGHMGLANTAALKLAGITADTKDPDGGVIGRMPDGKTPSGILKDNAMDLLDKLIPEPGEAEIAEGVRAAMKACAEQGITSVQDMDGNSPETRRKLFRIFQRLAQRGELTTRIDLRWPIGAQKELSAFGTEANFGGPFLSIGGLKGFMDGSLGSSTAKMFNGYVSDPKVNGVFVTKPEDMLALVKTADAARLSVCVHAIGDEANARLLDIYAEVAKQNGSRDRRFRIEHVQHLRPEDYPRFKQLGVVASMQPFHVVDDARWAEGRIGKVRCESSYAFRSLLDAGAVLAFGSDWPVVPLDVPAGIDAAVNRRPLDSKNHPGWYPAQKISVAEAISAYTLGSAYAGHQEKERGSLEAGKVADFVILSRDILAPAEKDTIAETKVDLTAIGGKVVFQRKK